MPSFAPSALASRRALAAVDAGLATTVQRLSSGLRVNSARDDAAGLAISERLAAHLRGTRQGERNANDAVSMLATADGTLQAMGGLLQRMRELLLQAQNGSNGSADRASLNSEMGQARDELGRIAGACSFNGHALLAGAAAGDEQSFQIGAGSDDTLHVATGAPMTAGDIGGIAIARSVDLRTLNDSDGGFAFTGTYTTVAISTLDFSKPQIAFRGGSARTSGAVATNYGGGNGVQFAVDGQTVTLAADYGSASGVAAAIQGQLGGYSVAADNGAIVITKGSGVASATVAPSITNGVGAASAAFTGASGSAGTAAQASTNAGFTVDGRRVSLTADHSGDAEALKADIQAQLDAGGAGRYSVNGGTAGLSITRVGAIDPPTVGDFTGIGGSVFAQAPRVPFELEAGDLTLQVGGGPVRAVVGRFETPQALVAAVAQQVPGVAVAVDRSTGRLEIIAARRLTVGGAAAGASGALAFESLVVDPSGSLLDADGRDSEDTRRSILRVDAAIDAVSAQRASLGASQSRLGAVISSLQDEAVLTAGGRGRIVDADLAQETSALARQRVLQQAALAVVAQANTHAGDVLALLR